MSLDTYIASLLIGVPLVLLAAHFRDALDVLDAAFARMTSGPSGLPLLAEPNEADEAPADIRRAA